MTRRAKAATTGRILEDETSSNTEPSRKAANQRQTVGRGGKSDGINRQAMPPRSTWKIALTISRIDHERGRPVFKAAGFGNWIGDCVRKAGLREGFGKGEKGFSSHGLRKAICRRLADSGCDAPQIMAITGHRDIKQILVHIEARDRSRAAEAAMKTIAGYGRKE